ncbi:MAG: hypothetical protein A2W19_17055 [Spirochaetes bacterium RBG_16_49_21]|nr:MAG: hypothetical protein A2W19_17055 [Spirochaetes bacterium RBG_16_49_21]
MDYGFTLETLRQIQIMVDNFGDEQLKKTHADNKARFQEAAESYYGLDYTASALKFYKLKKDLVSILEVMDDMYLKRTKEILDSTSKVSFQILIEYSKESGLASYLRKPFDPLNDIKLIDPDKYHFFQDREKIAAYIREGYKKYEKAKSIFNDPDIAFLKKKNKLPLNSINQIISSSIELVNLCREAKQSGIEIYRILNVNELGKSMIKYNITHATIMPVFDDRIPEKYKVDADDNLRLIHDVEMKKLKKR